MRFSIKGSGITLVVVAALIALVISGLALAGRDVSNGGNRYVSGAEHHHNRAERAAAQEQSEKRAAARERANFLGTRRLETPSGEVIWTLTEYEAPDGTCLEVVGEAAAGSDRGSTASCGVESNDSNFAWAIGGIDVGGQWFNVAYGRASSASQVRVTLGNGSVRSDAGVDAADGLWVLVVPADPLDSTTDIAKIEALDDSGLVIEQETPPSIVEARRAAVTSASDGGASSR